jgi:hypothetical protein
MSIHSLEQTGRAANHRQGPRTRGRGRLLSSTVRPRSLVSI